MRDWNLVGERDGPVGYVRVKTRSYVLPDGKTADWDIIVMGRTVGILAVTVDNQIVVARQFRPGPGRILNEVPGGYVEEHETPRQAAERELLEETGFRGDIRIVGETHLASNVDVQRFAAVATNCELVADAAPEAGEFCETVLMSISEFREHLRGGQLTDADIGYLGLDALGLL